MIELAVLMAHTYRATLRNCHYIQILIQNFIGVAAGHGEEQQEEEGIIFLYFFLLLSIQHEHHFPI